MPLSRIQSEILQILLSHRDPESYVAGSTPHNQNAHGILPALMFFKFDPRISLGGLARQSLALAT